MTRSVWIDRIYFYLHMSAENNSNAYPISLAELNDAESIAQGAEMFRSRDLDVGMTVKDPGARSIALLNAMRIRVDFWRRSGVRAEDIERNQQAFLERHNSGKLSQKEAERIISSAVELLAQTQGEPLQQPNKLRAI